jgi:hypothetical protein
VHHLTSLSLLTDDIASVANGGKKTAGLTFLKD